MWATGALPECSSPLPICWLTIAHLMDCHATRVLRIVSPVWQDSQQPAEFEFPRVELPPWFHFAGPLQDRRSRWNRCLSVRPTDGTTAHLRVDGDTAESAAHRSSRRSAAACEGIAVQLVISLGGAERSAAANLPGRPLVVSYAPQLELLEKATLVITHAGLNTVLEALSQGVPMVAIRSPTTSPVWRLALCGRKRGKSCRFLSPTLGRSAGRYAMCSRRSPAPSAHCASRGDLANRRCAPGRRDR